MHKRQGTWIYGTKLARKAKETDDSESQTASIVPSTSVAAKAAATTHVTSGVRLGGWLKRTTKVEETASRIAIDSNQDEPAADEEKLDMGWIPAAFVTKYSFA